MYAGPDQWLGGTTLSYGKKYTTYDRSFTLSGTPEFATARRLLNNRKPVRKDFFQGKNTGKKSRNRFKLAIKRHDHLVFLKAAKLQGDRQRAEAQRAKHEASFKYNLRAA